MTSTVSLNFPLRLFVDATRGLHVDPQAAGQVYRPVDLARAHGYPVGAEIMRAAVRGEVDAALRAVDRSHAQLLADRETLDAVEMTVAVLTAAATGWRIWRPSCGRCGPPTDLGRWRSRCTGGGAGWPRGGARCWWPPAASPTLDAAGG
jgi:hypothetical protein